MSLLLSRRFQMFSLIAASMSLTPQVLADSEWFSRQKSIILAQQLDQPSASASKTMTVPSDETERSELSLAAKLPSKQRLGSPLCPDCVETGHAIDLFKQWHEVSVDSSWLL